jgi:hypothetical protein
LNLGLVDEWFTSFNGRGINLVNIFLLVFGREALDDRLDGVLLGIGVVSGEDETSRSSHTGVLGVIFNALFLGEDR